MTITTVKLSKLIPSKENVRRYKSDAGIEQLAADISGRGLLQNLVVKPSTKGKLEVIAGGRRLKALHHIQKSAGTVAGIKVTKDFELSVLVRDEKNVSATEDSLAENFQRSAMHPADEIEAFGKLNKDEGLSPEQIADRFGISHMTVRRRLALANLSPRILEELRQDNMTLQQAEALSLSAEHSRQEAAWFETKNSYLRDPSHLKQRVSEGRLRPSDKIARFIHAEYLEADGATERDLFTETEQAYLIDTELAYRLVNEKLERAKSDLASEGWKWVEVIADFDYSQSSKYGRVYPEHVALSDDDQTKYDALTTEQEALTETLDERELYGDADEDEIAELPEADAALVRRYQQIEQELAVLSDRELLYTDEDKATAGVIVTIDYQGNLKVERGLVSPYDRAKDTDSKPKAERNSNMEAAEADTAPLSAALIEDLTAQRSAALALEMSKRPDVALVALVHSLSLQHFYYGYGYERNRAESSVQIKRDLTPRASKEAEQTSAIRALDDLKSQWKKTLPKASGDLWNWCLECDPATLNNLMAYLVGSSINATQQRHEKRGKRIEHSDRIADALDFDMSKHWQPDAEFFRRTSKVYMGEAIMDGAGDTYEPVVKALTKADKAGAVSAAVDALSGRGWLPVALRTQAETVVEDGSDLDDQDESDDEDDC